MLMKYFQIAEETNKRITGLTGPQCMVFPTGYTLEWYDEPCSLTKLNNNVFPNEKTEFIFELDDTAKTTDFISQAIIPARGFLINEKVKVLLNEINLPEHKYFPAIVISKGVRLNYFWLHLIDSNYEDIDYGKSNFYEGFAPGWKEQNCKLNSAKALFDLQKLEIIPTIWADTLHMNESSLNIKIDLFIFSLLHQNIFISDRAVEILNSQNVNGYKIIEQNILK